MNIAFFKKNERKIFWTSIFILVILAFVGFVSSFNSPADYQQGDFVRIMYVHVPSAWMALGIYVFIGVCSVAYIVWRNIFFDIAANQAALIGGAFAFITLITGSVWGHNIWGTWWVWDARLTSMLILFLFYVAYISLCGAVKDKIVRSDVPAVLAIVGMINIPIIKFSVNVWATLHQPSSFFRTSGVAIDKSMFLPLMSMFLFCIVFFVVLLIVRIRSEILRKKILRIERNYLS